MQLTAIFESWLIWDKAYTPFSKGEAVNLSFRMDTQRLEWCPAGLEEFTHIRDAEYRFRGRVILVYSSEEKPFVVVETLGFRFYTNGRHLRPLQLGYRNPGDWVVGEGTLLLDYGDWFSHGIHDPNLFFKLLVKNIWKVNRLGDSERMPLDTMKGRNVDEELYIIDFDDVGLSGEAIPRTLGHGA
ncbi:MAG: hypothetical protein ACRDIC_03435 [bacterium]